MRVTLQGRLGHVPMGPWIQTGTSPRASLQISTTQWDHEYSASDFDVGTGVVPENAFLDTLTDARSRENGTTAGALKPPIPLMGQETGCNHRRQRTVRPGAVQVPVETPSETGCKPPVRGAVCTRSRPLTMLFPMSPE